MCGLRGNVGYSAGRKWVGVFMNFAMFGVIALWWGVIAQEIQKVFPEAVHVGPGGYLLVDYNQLGMCISDAVAAR
jgi:hypothetical protein